MSDNNEKCLSEVRKLAKEKNKLHPNDPSISNYWDSLNELLTRDISLTINILEQCNQEEISSLQDVFEAISNDLKSVEFSNYLERLQEKHPGLNLAADILYSKNVLKNQIHR